MKATEKSELSEISHDNGIFMYSQVVTVVKGNSVKMGIREFKKFDKVLTNIIYILLYKSIIK